MTEVILLAGGTGSRMASTVADKILAPLAGKSSFQRCLEAFRAAGLEGRLIVVTRGGAQQDVLAAQAAELDIKPHFVAAGEERQDSVRNGLAATSEGQHLVFIHDCARPLIDPESLRLVAETAARDGAAALAHAVTDTIKRVPVAGARDRVALEDLDRTRLWAMETPQVFRRDWIHQAYADARGRLTDDVAAAVAAGHGVTVVPNPHPNPKLTRPEDFAFFEWLLNQSETPLQ